MQNQVLFFFEQGQFAEAEKVLKERLLDEQCPYGRTGLKVCQFWSGRLEQLEKWQDDTLRGDFLYGQWFRFIELYRWDLLRDFESALPALKAWLFHQVINSYERTMGMIRTADTESHLKVGRSLKYLGRYEEALPLVEKALKYHRSSSEIMAELADCYGLINEVELSKALFREAYLVDPQGVKLALLESSFMIRLCERVMKETDYKDREFNEWIPVFAVVYGIFDVKREMKQEEIGMLKQSIYSLKSDLKEAGREWKTVPRLLYRYFWLIDLYRSQGASQNLIRQVLMDIQLLDPQIYQLYMN
ncbi:MAG: tetratricopeptide repeat protein [Spirochaetaceae bacterium]|jgi:tetratricopeptide (TPR) repeat protein|nr:tetratricopeptide repeat protein [Spirochaetaceae bacterium]